MKLDPQTTRQLIEMVKSTDKENRVLAYALTMEYIQHIMFPIQRNIGYLLLILKFIDNDDEDVNKEKLIKIVGSRTRTKTLTFNQIIDFTCTHVKETDLEQRTLVYEYACESIRKKLNVKNEQTRTTG